MDLRGEGAGARDRGPGGAAVAVARVPDGVAAGMQFNRHLTFGIYVD